MGDITEKKDETLEEFEPEIVDLDGEPFEVIDGINFEGTNYLALVPYSEEEEDESEEETQFIILKEVEENGEYFLATIDDDDLYSRIGEMFIKQFDDEMGELDELDEK